jgi:hypothetical protein
MTAHRRALVVVVAVLACVYAGSLQAPRSSFIPAIEAKTPSPAADGLRLKDASADSIRLSLSIAGEVTWTAIDADGVAYDRASLPGSELYGQSGAPDLPVFRRILALPDCDSVTLRVQLGSTTRVEGVRVVPFPRSYRDGEGSGEATEELWEDSTYYESDEVFPPLFARVTNQSYMRGQLLAVVEICPVQFDAQNEVVEIVEDATIVLHMHGVMSDN